MASTRRARGSRSRAIFAAGLLAAAAVTTLPAGAATKPVLEASTVDNGWSNGRVIIAQYDKDIRGGQEVSVTLADDSAVVDGKGNTITGVVSTAYSESFLEYDLVVWQPNLEDRVDSRNVPLRALPEGDYKMTVNATSDDATPLTSDTSTLNFKVDNLGPSTLSFTGPSMDEPVVGAALATGVVTDNKKSGEFRSGVASVVLHFFNAASTNYTIVPTFSIDTELGPVAVPDPEGEGEIEVWDGRVNIGSPQSTEIRSLRRFASLTACTQNDDACLGTDQFGTPIVVEEKLFEADISDLGPGLWTIKAIAFDFAGNQSGEKSTTFLKIA